MQKVCTAFPVRREIFPIGFSTKSSASNARNLAWRRAGAYRAALRNPAVDTFSHHL
jgi:hypothetical protein